MRLLPTRRLALSSLIVLAGLTGCAGPDAAPEQAGAPARAPGQPPATPAPAPGQPPVGDAQRPGGPPPGPIAQQAGGTPAAGGGGLLDQLAADLGLRDQERRALAQHYFTT